MPTISDEAIEAKFRSIPVFPEYGLKYHRILDEALFDKSTSDASVKGTQIANRIRDEFSLLSGSAQLRKAFGESMIIFIRCADYSPPDHHFQDVIMEVLNQLRKFPGPDPVNETAFYRYEPDEEHDVEGDVLRWKSYTSFLARFCSGGWVFARWPVLECRRAFENPDEKGAPMETRVWGATEWILRCGGLWTHYLTDLTEADDGMRDLYEVGQLLKGSDTPVFGKARWEFWKTRLVEMKGKLESYDMGEVTAERIDMAVDKLDELLRTMKWKE